MKNRIFRTLLTLALALFTLPMLSQDFMIIYFKNGDFRKFYMKNITEIVASRVDKEGVQHSDYCSQSITTIYDTYVYDLEDVDSITFTKIDEEKAKQSFITAMPEVFATIDKCETIEDVKDKIEDIKNTEGVADAWSDGHELYVTVEEGETYSFHFNHNKDNDDNSSEEAIAQIRAMIPTIKKTVNKEGRKISAVIANQQDKDEKFSKNKDNYLKLIEYFHKCDINAKYEDNLNIDFFYQNSSDPEHLNIYDYDIIFLITHGGYGSFLFWNNEYYYDNKGNLQKKFERSNEKIHKILLSDDIALVKNNYWDKYYDEFKDWRDKTSFKDLNDVYINYSFCKEKRPEGEYWVAHPTLTEWFFEDIADGVFHDNSILFNTSCQSLKGDNDNPSYSFAEILVKKNLRVYLGYDETDNAGPDAGCNLYYNMLFGNSLKKVYDNLDDEERHDHVLEGLHLIVANLLIYPPDNSEVERLFLFPIVTNEIDSEKATNDFNEHGYVEVEGLATMLNADDPKILNALSYGFEYKLEGDHTWTRITTKDLLVLSKTIDKGNVLFKGQLTNLQYGQTYTYRAYTHDGLYYNYGDIQSFNIGFDPEKPDPNLKVGHCFIIKDVAYTVTNNRGGFYTCKVGYGTGAGSRPKQAGSTIEPAIAPDTEGPVTIPEFAAGFTVTEVGINAFKDCGKVTVINLPETVSEIGESAMSGCIGLSSITIPKNVKKIDRNAFGGCKNVKSIYAEMTTPFSIAENVFQTASEELAGTPSTIFANATLYVPVGSKNQYATTPGWNKFQRIDEYTPGGEMPDPGPGGDITVYTSCPDDHHPHLIDLGLPSGTKWACCNVGASRPEDYGSYYAWGETEEKDDYDGSVIINSILFDLEIGTNFSGTQFDVAHVKWGSVWVLPNFDQLRELICNTTSEWTIQNGVNGRIFTGNNGGTVFLPAAGVSPSYYVSNDTFGVYYSSSYYGNQNYHGIGFDFEKVYQWSGSNYCGYVVRPVASSSGSTSDPDNPNPNNPDDSIINFADPAVANICIERWDTNGDGELSKDEAAAVTDLGEVFKENEEITSFDELQYFTGLSSIGKRAFFACTGLATIRIPNSVKIIDTYSFQSCKSLVSVTIPKGVTSIASGAFWNCTSLTSIDVDEGNSVYVSENGILFDKNLTTIMCYPNGKPENTYIIPNSVAIIGDWAFTESYNLTTIIIPESVISIGKYAFAHCYELTSIIIGNSVASIGENAFQQCNNLNSLTIPSSVTKIERCAFEFCDNLSEVISYINEPFTINNNVFLLTDRTHYSNAILYVPAGTKAKYETTDGWKNFKNIVEMGGDDDPVSQQEIDKLNAELDNLIAQIRDVWGKLYNKTFGEEKRFTADIYGKLSEVSMRLQQCRTMLSVVKTQKEMESLKAEVASIAELLSTAAQQTEAFSLSFGDTFVATSAEGIELKFTVLSAQEKTCLVGDMSQQHSHSALTNIDQTGSVTVPATVNYKGETYKVTEIGPGAFSSCRLSFINIPSVSHIWMNAFWYSQITEITIPESVTGMGPQIFSRCSQLKKVTCLIKEPFVIDASMFDGIPDDATLYVPAGTKARYEATEGWNLFKNIVEME